MKWWIAALVIGSASDVATAGFVSGKDLYEKGVEDEVAESHPVGRFSGIKAGQFQGYVAAVVDSFPSLCVPLDAKLGEVGAEVMKYLRSHPEDWHLNASNLVQSAFVEAWPCKKP